MLLRAIINQPHIDCPRLFLFIITLILTINLSLQAVTEFFETLMENNHKLQIILYFISRMEKNV